MTATELNQTEIKLINYLRVSPKSGNDLLNSGLIKNTAVLNNLLIKLENLGFLIYEDSKMKRSKNIEYGLIGVREGSFAEEYLKENK